MDYFDEFFDSVRHKSSEVIAEVAGDQSTPDKLWHYTTSAGLIGIIENQNLRFSDVMFMNDRSEFFYGIEAVLHNLELIRKETGHDEVIDGILKYYRNIQTNIRLLSFSLCDGVNLLNQWRAYGTGDVSYCIGFDMKELLSIPVDRETFNWRIVKIIYDKEQQKHVLTSLIHSLLDEANKVISDNDNTEVMKNNFLNFCAVQIVSAAASFKNPSFESEKEYRLIAELTPERAPKGQYRTNKLGIVPYYEWSIDEGSTNLPITDIMIGPTVEPKTSEMGLRLFLNDMNCQHIKSKPSNTPLRW